MTASLHHLPTPERIILNKKQLASHLGMSVRWVEVRMSEGMPVLESRDRRGGRRFELREVERWLVDRPKPLSLEQRVSQLEQELQAIRRAG